MAKFSWVAELLIDSITPVVNLVLRVFGYDEDWEPLDRQRPPSRTGAILFCFVLSALVAFGLVALAWWVSRNG